MEEEYRMQKAQGEMHQVLSKQKPAPARERDVGNAVIHEDGTVVRDSVDDNASTRGVMSPPSPVLAATEDADVNGNELEHPSTIPTIRISTESQRVNKEDDQSEATKVEEETPVPSKDKGKAKATDEDEAGQEVLTNGHGQPNGVERPAQAAGEGEQAVNEASTPAATQESFSFSNKRLCERWLDNLFMVLYEVRHYPSFVFALIPDCDFPRTCVSGQSSVLKLPTSRPNTSPTARQGWSGRF